MELITTKLFRKGKKEFITLAIGLSLPESMLMTAKMLYGDQKMRYASKIRLPCLLAFFLASCNLLLIF